MTIESIEGVEKGKGGMNPDKMGWDKKLRNIMLILLIPMIIIYSFSILMNDRGYFEFVLYEIMSGIPLNFIFTAFFIYYSWKYLNKTKEEKTGPVKTDFSGWIIMGFLFLSSIYMIFTGKAIPFPFDFVLNAFFSSGYIDGVFMYPLILYWEKKNRMTIYLVEEKPSKWRPVAIPAQILQQQVNRGTER